jgi:hypothetical protein
MRLVHFPGGGWKKKFPLAVVKVEDQSKVIVSTGSTEIAHTEERNNETKNIITRASANRNKLRQSLSAASSTNSSPSTSRLTDDVKKPGHASSNAPDDLLSYKLRQGVSPPLDSSNSVVVSSDESFAVKNNKRGNGSRGGTRVASTQDLKSPSPQRPKRNICMKKLVGIVLKMWCFFAVLGYFVSCYNSQLNLWNLLSPGLYKNTEVEG